MPAQLICVSHGPALTNPHPVPEEHDEIIESYAARAASLCEFDPELLIVFGPDHFTNIHFGSVPPFMIGFAAEAVDDYGGFPGSFSVPRDLANECFLALREQGFDIALSQYLIVDHGFSQPVHLLAGGLDRFAVLPIFINTTCWPPSSFRRIRHLGEAIGRFASKLGMRISFLGSGGLSHHPVNIFPQRLEDASDAVREYLLFGGRRGGMNYIDWIRYLGEQTERGGNLVARGERTAEHCRLNPEWDRRFLNLMVAGDYSVFDSWTPEAVVREAGIAAIEVHQWIAAAAAAQVVGTDRAIIDFYAPVVEYRLSVGVLHADPVAKA